jgi:hypothetical protein
MLAIKNNVRKYASSVLLIGAVLFLMSEPANSQQVSAEVVKLTTRGDVTQQYLLIKQSDQPKVVAVLFTGGDAAPKFSGTHPNIRWEPTGSSYVLMARAHFREPDVALVFPDAASDRWNLGQDQHFRSSNDHATDIRSLLSDVKKRFPGAKVYFIGTSMGTVSASRVGRAMGKEIDGVVLTASIFVGPMTLSSSDVADFPTSLLFVHHVNDPCQWTPYSAIAKFSDKYPVIEVTGGETARDNGCGPMGPHGFLGREKEVATEIKNWMLGRPFARQIQ